MVTYDPQQGFLIDGKPANLYGRTGRNVLGFSTRDRGVGGNDYDPRYYEAYTYNNGDAGEQTAYRLRPEYQERLGNRVQLNSHSVGGYGEVIDPSQVDYDEEFGLLTDQRNIKDPATPRDNLMGNLAMAAFAAPIAYGVALNSGLLGAGAGSMGTVSGLEPITLPALEGAPTLASIDGLGTMATDVPWYTQALANAGANLSNPITAARALLGAGSLIDTLTHKPSGSNPGSSLLGGSGPAVPAFNPEGLLSGYKPMQFDPVPFMSGRYGR